MVNITPKQAIRVAEQDPNMTPKERQTLLAIAIVELIISTPEKPTKPSEAKKLWEKSQHVSPHAIPNYDTEFILKTHKKSIGRD